MLGTGVGAVLGGVLLIINFPGWIRVVGTVVLAAGAIPFLLGVVMSIYGALGKFRMRDLMISRINWRGDESVLDVGTGLGLLLIAAAKKLDKGGRAVGIDIWREEDLSGNGLDQLAVNVDIEGVENRISLLTQDVRKLSFPDQSFDVVLSLYCIHNVEDVAEQRNACLEICRVLKPGGKVLIGEYIPTHRYAEFFREAGLCVLYSRPFFLTALGPMWMVEAVKRGHTPA